MNIRLDEAFFWDIIRQGNQSQNEEPFDTDEHIDQIVTVLSQYEKDDFILFEKVLREKINQLNKVEIADFYIILNNFFEFKKEVYDFEGYISTDDFIYFRCWLILQGKEFFYDIVQNIESFISGDYSCDIGDTSAEGLLYVSETAYEVKYDKEDSLVIRDATDLLYPEIEHYDLAESDWVREPYSGKELQKHYPELVREIGELRSE
ncbi:DUF4240 domain-containing protein [Myroides albus]|uniref:DUF4240 domain-containing protein n=1 Tax=Myroides albus TaxID=2562892 RepID=A0A6I3LJM4_9FLAO|nr:DUF4240 domain-containing protein [Myroides albus]MTG97400.1 DUF4240 domain-containing protein [Myroides albus]UVD79429.1 DUF4240 domain-containing protein [Myroides albus]